jgi:hypothetical protein
MGIDFSYGDAHWSYSGFDHFRQQLALLIGIDLDTMQGHGGKGDWGNVSDPIRDLLNHSDCGGELNPDQCLAIAPRLRELASRLESYDAHHARLLAEAMLAAAHAGEPLKFQ